ncbi:tyrosine-type recombinase/integrase [Polynucleobacter sp. 31A-FELB]|uniref:site-specific integrase n=1 Tax=Polynucleobacter sp. 31A-FELB TaxID=2689096 RepID=UPI001C0C9538|nr:site-specific integrase [Polynucleobacter sp. 31A-FELB]MBU3587811.1 tyrosine-type recombinase/integrase [Polynucleobacter sp. 31A-FELB]
MPKLQLNAELVKELVCPKEKAKWDVFDINCKGLMLEVRQSGGKTYYLRYTDERGRSHQMKLAAASDITLSQARQMANIARSKIAMGEDPAAEKAIKKSVPTFEQFIAERYMPFVRSYKKAANSDDSYLRNQILPVLGKKYLDEITRKDIIDFHHGLHAKGYKPGTCNRSLILLRYAFNLAIRWDIPGVKTNPTKDVALLNDQEGKKERYLTKEETERLYGVLKDSDNALLQYIIPMLILTGARKREVLDARWEDLDLDRRQWRIPITKAGRPRYVPLSNGVLHLLANVPHTDGNPWVFPNPKTGKPYVSIFNSWNAARIAAGLADVRIHDLRHSFASFLVNAGRSLYEVQRILGHTQIKTTQRYAHLSQDTLLDAADAAHQMAGGMVYAIESVTPDQLGYRNI